MIYIIIPLIAISLITIIYILFTRIYFLRDPIRKIPSGNTIVSPANGKIVAIQKIDNKVDKIKIKKSLIGKIKTFCNYSKQPKIMLSIMMNVHNVHVQRVPIGGKVVSIKYNKGKFLNAVKDAEKMLWLENENIETIIKNPKLGKIKVIQIAGFLARRCISSLKINQKVLKGEKLGIIKLGSQVTILMPAKVKLKVKTGDKVIDGESIIAEY